MWLGHVIVSLVNSAKNLNNGSPKICHILINRTYHGCACMCMHVCVSVSAMSLCVSVCVCIFSCVCTKARGQPEVSSSGTPAASFEVGCHWPGASSDVLCLRLASLPCWAPYALAPIAISSFYWFVSLENPDSTHSGLGCLLPTPSRQAIDDIHNLVSEQCWSGLAQCCGCQGKGKMDVG